MRALALCFLLTALCGCSKYQDFTLPALAAGRDVTWQWRPSPDPVLVPGAANEWDHSDVLNPSVLRHGAEYWNLYSGFDGKMWHTGLATSPDGTSWQKRSLILSPAPGTWEGDYIAANGSLVEGERSLLYFYQGGRPAQIGLATSPNGRQWHKYAYPVLAPGPYGSWDERGVADPYVIRQDHRLYLFYTGLDRAQRQRLGVAVSDDDGIHWSKLRSNPILEVGEYGAFDENGLGEPAVWSAYGNYWMLYTGRNRQENRGLGMARSRDGVHWERTPLHITGDQPWDSKVICDPTVIVGAERVRVWFGGGDVASPDENLHGRIGYGELVPQP